MADGLVAELEWRLDELKDVTLSHDRFYGENWSRVNTILTCLQREGHKDWLRLFEVYQDRMQAYRSYKEPSTSSKNSEEKMLVRLDDESVNKIAFDHPDDVVSYEFQSYDPYEKVWNTVVEYKTLDEAEEEMCMLPANVDGYFRVAKITKSTEIQSRYRGIMSEDERKEVLSLIREGKVQS